VRWGRGCGVRDERRDGDVIVGVLWVRLGVDVLGDGAGEGRAVRSDVRPRRSESFRGELRGEGLEQGDDVDADVGG
jgi:hypothetical protein